MEFKSLSENIIDKGQQKLSNEITPEKTVKDVSETTGIDRITIEAPNDNNKYQKVLPGVEVPSPFKTALFWPEPTVAKKWKMKKEKVPSVTTSDAWKAYYTKKNEEKKKIEDEKEQRKRMRKEKKTMAEENANKRNKRSKKNNEEDKENHISENEVDIENEDTQNEPETKVNDYVVVIYEQEQYPGIITEVKDNGVKVKAMCKSGPNHWKWPKVNDEIWYGFQEIIKKIGPPVQVNKRNVFEVKELTK